MRTGSQREELPEYQMFPKGMWHMIGAAVCMAPALGLLLVFLALVSSQWLSDGTVLVGSLVLFFLSVFVLVTPTFLLSRGRSKWHGFLLRFNLLLIGALATASLVSPLRENTNLFLTTFAGLGFATVARFFYKSNAYTGCVEYYRAIWAHQRRSSPSSTSPKP
ncbi:hypothetical protein [Hydrocarboniclastica marina]|uniref:DUF2231 domain-containing protein n=1 Tax=Hydrocarboniclastica marina TaxID=2259620 RepID=A0A4P7XKY0_9ALTE|nr:hypothetical protein [Hydrocarboniclastica marina]QCF27164.1 hypothetical protein soil367_15180 [Hydrocarboniclastica marina]